MADHCDPAKAVLRTSNIPRRGPCLVLEVSSEHLLHKDASERGLQKLDSRLYEVMLWHRHVCAMYEGTLTEITERQRARYRSISSLGPSTSRSDQSIACNGSAGDDRLLRQYRAREFNLEAHMCGTLLSPGMATARYLVYRTFHVVGMGIFQTTCASLNDPP